MKVLMPLMGLPLTPENINGGVSAAVYNLLPGFATIGGLELHILSFNQNLVSPSTICNDNVIIHFEPYRITGWNKFDFILTSISRFSYFVKLIRPDVIHYQMHGLFLIMRLFSLRKKVHEIITIHGLSKLEASYASSIGNGLTKRLSELANSLLIPRNAIFISKYSQSQYAKYCFKNEIVVFNSVNVEFFQVRSNTRYNGRLLYIGHITRLKNLKLLLKALDNLRNEGMTFSLQVIGNFCDREYEEEIYDYIDGKQLSDTVSFLGYKSQPEIAKILESIDVLVLTSKQENLPVVITEAMTSGKVVIAPNIGGIPEMLVHDFTGYLYNPGCLEELCLILKNLDQKIAKSVGANAREFAKSNFNPFRNAEKIFKFYEAITLT